jgi:hypothetical protein
MTITLSAFRAQAGFAGYNVQPVASAVWNDALQEVVISGTGSVGTVAPVTLNKSTTPVTNSAYVQVVASLSAAVSKITVSNSGNAPILLATGTIGNEVNRLAIHPANAATTYDLYMPAGTRISVISADGTLNSGFTVINFIS